MMVSLKDHVLMLVSLPLWIIFTVSLHAERTIVVDKDNCGGALNLNIIQTLHLKYYGAKLGSNTLPNYMLDDQICLFNVSSIFNASTEMCIFNRHFTSWDTVCSSSLKVTLSRYLGVHIPSMLYCTDFKPLCTSEKIVFLEFKYSRVLHILEKNIVVEFDIYLRNKIVTTERPRYTTRLPSLSSDSEDEFHLAPTYIVLICIGGILVMIFCCSLLYFCCIDDEKEGESGNENSPPLQDNDVNMRMLQTPVVHTPPENRHQYPADPPEFRHHFSTDPPDYYDVCRSEVTQEKSPDMQFQNNSGSSDGRVIPSAPSPPYPGE